MVILKHIIMNEEKDLNTYLIVSFLAGFAMMEFVTMLRRSSKALFGSSN